MPTGTCGAFEALHQFLAFVVGHRGEDKLTVDGEGAGRKRVQVEFVLVTIAIHGHAVPTVRVVRWSFAAAAHVNTCWVTSIGVEVLDDVGHVLLSW